MNLQYITNTEPPPAQSVLQYSISPDTVFVSTATQPMYANLTITVFNPSTGAVTCQMFRVRLLRRGRVRRPHNQRHRHTDFI